MDWNYVYGCQETDKACVWSGSLIKKEIYKAWSCFPFHITCQEAKLCEPEHYVIDGTDTD